MANKSLTDLTARTATADSDLIHVNSGGTDYKQAKLNFLQGGLAVDWATDSLLTSQVNALPKGSYFGVILSNGHQTETGVPQNASFYVHAFNYSNASGIIYITQMNNGDNYYIRKYQSTWESSWTKDPTRAEISSINNSLANIGTRNVTYYASNATAATFSYTGVSFTITKKSIVRADLYYTYSSPQEIAICGGASGNQIVYGHASAVSGITNTCIGCTALLAPGTYYIWARSGSAANNSIGITGYQIEP